MILRNPTDNELSVQIKGRTYTLPARETISLPEEDGRAWLRLHGFLLEEEEKAVQPEPTEQVAPVEPVVEPEPTADITTAPTDIVTEEKPEPKKRGGRTKK